MGFQPKSREEMAALFGVPLEAVPEVPTTEASREAEAVLIYLQYKEGTFTERVCAQCQQKFAVTPANVRYCSDNCRAAALAEKGIEWNPSKAPEHRWGHLRVVETKLPSGENRARTVIHANLPLVVPPAALSLVKQISEAESLLAEVDAQSG